MAHTYLTRVLFLCVKYVLNMCLMCGHFVRVDLNLAPFTDND